MKKELLIIWDYCKPYIIKVRDFIKLNILYIVWFAIYDLVTTLFLMPFLKEGTLVICTVFYIFSVFIAWTMGDEILQLIENIRPLETRKEIEYLTPIFEDVYSDVKENIANLPKIDIHIIDKLSVNACAVGNHTIAVTQGAINTFSEEELKGIIAHEIAHIQNGNTKAIILNTLGNGIISLFILIVQFIFRLLLNFQEPIEKRTYGVLYFFLNLLYRLFSFLIHCFLFIGDIILSGNSRQAEYEADKFAFNVGYGKELTDALYLLQKMSLGEDMRLVERMQARHPRISSRIKMLEEMTDKEELQGLDEP